ncbi:hypothetical protein [Nonomuraea ceibae]|uniref:hypothetical protein n=1 Tax=Nonomuraea ceibae TaxID=1935170 RepID=UPI001C5DBDA1|nr:hypothetical protein [Nonomuraea ceibae]
MGRSVVTFAAELTGPLPILIYACNWLISLAFVVTIVIVTVDMGQRQALDELAMG